MLSAERDANDGDTEQQTEKDMQQCNDESRKEPQDIQRYAKTAVEPAAVADCCAERPKAENAKFETLHSPRNTDDGAAQRKASGEIAEGGLESAEDKPDQIT